MASRISALIIVDMINTLDFVEGKAVLKSAMPVARQIARLKQRWKRRNQPVIYANDNYGQWRSDFRQIIECCAQPDSLGSPLVELVHPEPDDYFVLKRRHSAFFETPLQGLLDSLHVDSITVCGLTIENCILATAIDANVRGFDLHVPSNCVASSTPARKAAALVVLKAMKIDTRSI